MTSTAILPDHDVDTTRSLIFRAAGRVYACPVDAVREVFPLGHATRLPGASNAIIGLMNVRGTIVTVVDACMLLHGVPADRNASAVLLIDAGARGVGFAVDIVSDVRAIRPDEEYLELDVRAAVARVVILSEDA